MLAIVERNDVSYTGQSNALGTPRLDSYAPADVGQQQCIVYPGPRMQQRTSIATESRRYTLGDMFVIVLEYLRDGEVVARHRTLPVEGHGEGILKALESFCEAFDFQYRNLVDVPESELTSGGLRRRRLMEQAVVHVEELG